MTTHPEPPPEPMDPNDAGFTDPKHRTGALCIVKDCGSPAGTAWCPFWCPKHDKERLDRIRLSLWKDRQLGSCQMTPRRRRLMVTLGNSLVVLGQREVERRAAFLIPERYRPSPLLWILAAMAAG